MLQKSSYFKKLHPWNVISAEKWKSQIVDYVLQVQLAGQRVKYLYLVLYQVFTDTVFF